MHPLQPGDPKMLGDYVLSERLPGGPRGATFLGRKSDDAPVRVIKLLTGMPEQDTESVARFTAARRISSSYVARTVDIGVHDGHPYVVREHVQGRSLTETLAAHGPLDADAVERAAVGMLTALTAVHVAGITHRGLTPDNVIMGVDGPRVTDPDLGDAVGEIGYRSPEQLKGEPYGLSADLFAWAATVVFAATGKAPFDHDADAVLTGVPELGALAEPLRAVVLEALSKDDKQRPTVYKAMLRLLGGQKANVEATARLSAAPVSAQLPMLEPPSLLPVDGSSLPSGPGSGNPPLEGVPVQPPPLPPPMPPQSWGPPQQPTREPPRRPRVWRTSVVDDSGPRRKFPVALAASVAALMVLSGLGLWGASHYADAQRINSIDVAADGKATGNVATPTDAAKSAVADPGDGTVPQPNDQDSGRPQEEVTVPWATSSDDPYGVGPLVLPTEKPSGAPTAPVYSTVPTPSPVPSQPVPTVQPTTTASANPQATSTQPKTPQATKTVTKAPTDQPTTTPEQSQEPKASPTTSTEAPPSTPSPSRSTQASTPVPPPTTQAPAPASEPTKSAAPPPVQPEPKNPYSAAQVCGPGFYVQRSQPFNGGETFQLYNTGTKQNCVMTMKYAGVGTASPVSATLDVQGGDSATDSGAYKYYAGPVKLPAPGKCVKFSGSVGAGSTSAGWANCG
ncbi:hypothetical protein ACIBQ1_34275 [Nonomuraea sp. NPDC050153]|uniref:protein kinase domain-containing protein n=1 Tax=Nonomuraea sp. NPDC050153 TaxID=3364359 RepID=UPI00378B5127